MIDNEKKLATSTHTLQCVESHARRVSLQKWFGLLLRGMAMGIADLLPGVSGGTIALLTGIYPRFIQALAGIRLALKYAISLRMRDAFFACDGWLLSALACGITMSIFTWAKLVHYLMDTYPAEVLSVFCALVMYTGGKLLWQANVEATYTKNRLSVVLMFVIGIALAFWMRDILSWFPEFNTQSGTQIIWPIFILAGALSISVMLLPGVSGSLLLLVLGLYQPLLAAVATMNIAIIVAFACGALTGLLLFVPVLHYCYTHYRFLTIALLAGLCFGAVRDTAKLPVTTFMSFPDARVSIVTLFVVGAFVVILIDYRNKKIKYR